MTLRNAIFTVTLHSDSPTSNTNSSAMVISSWTSISSANRSIVRSSSDSKVEFQYYLIGVYCFFGLLFTIGILLMLIRKINRACCSRKKLVREDYESVPSGPNLNPHDNLAFEHHVNADNLDVERVPEHDSDYDYYSDEESVTEHSKDKPPAYEHPPSYDKSVEN